MKTCFICKSLFPVGLTTFKFEITKLLQYNLLVQTEKLCIFNEVVLLSFWISLNISSPAENLTLEWANKLADNILNPSRPNPGRREKKLSYNLFSHFFVVPQKVI